MYLHLLTTNDSKNLYEIGFRAVNCNNNIIIVVIIIMKLVFGKVIKYKLQTIHLLVYYRYFFVALIARRLLVTDYIVV